MVKKLDYGEGWTWLYNSRKWHYFRENRSLCDKFLLLGIGNHQFELGKNDSPDNCKKCVSILLKEKKN